MKNSGKVFEDNFRDSAEQVMTFIRLKDPAQSFNLECKGCKKQKTRFSPKNICDFIGFKPPCMYLFELKSHLKSSIPIKAIVKNDEDKRLEKMAIMGRRTGIGAFVVFNWRDHGNITVAVEANIVLKYIQFSGRKSIPWKFTVDEGIPIEHAEMTKNKKYFLGNFLRHADIK